MDSLFVSLRLADVHHDLLRNIVAVPAGFNAFDDLSDDARDWQLAREVSAEVSPPWGRTSAAVVNQPFEDARWLNAIEWPFKNWRASRFSDGTFGVWYGSDSVLTTVYESAYHWYRGLLSDAGLGGEPVVSRRCALAVMCQAALIDLRTVLDQHPELLHPSDYTLCRTVGARIHHEGHPGLVTQSARYAGGENYAIFSPQVLSDPRHWGYLTYRLDGDHIAIEKDPGVTWRVLRVGVDV